MRERIVALIFHFPAGASGRQGVVGQGVIGHKGVVIEEAAIMFLGDGQFAPVDVQGVGFYAEGHIIHIAVRPAFAIIAAIGIALVTWIGTWFIGLFIH